MADREHYETKDADPRYLQGTTREIELILIKTRQLRRDNHDAGRQIEAAACAIRERALLECLEVLKRGDEHHVEERSAQEAFG